MTNRQKLKRLVIEAIHGLPYEEAIKKELVCGCNFNIIDYWHKNGKARTEVLLSINDEMDDEEGKCWRLDFLSGEEFLASQDIINVFDGKQMLRNEKDWEITILGLPITIGRVMQALKKQDLLFVVEDCFLNFAFEDVEDIECQWKLTKDNRQECTDEDQNNETIDKLIELIKG